MIVLFVFIVFHSQLLSVLCDMRQFKMERLCMTLQKPSGTELNNSQLKTNFECAVSCFETFSCGCFSFQKDPVNTPGSCYLYTGTVTCGTESSLSSAWSTYYFGNETFHLGCEDGWDEFESSCYLLVTSPMDFPGSVDYCAGLDGHLVSITSSQENTFVFDLPVLNGYNHRKLWLGAHDLITDGTWQWVSGEPWSFSYFISGEPNGGTHENELAMIESQGYWIDLYWDNLEFAVCEKNL